jgi:hypothetical protein
LVEQAEGNDSPKYGRFGVLCAERTADAGEAVGSSADDRHMGIPLRLKLEGVPGVLGSVVDVSSHPASSLFDRRPVVFTAHSAESAYLRERICAYVLNEGAIPINPWMVGGYFLYGLVDKSAVRRANNNLLMRSDELWVFGPASARAPEVTGPSSWSGPSGRLGG